MTPAADIITMLDSDGTPALESAVPAALSLLRTQLDHVRQRRPVFGNYIHNYLIDL